VCSGDGMEIDGGDGSFDGTNTTFSWTICGNVDPCTISDFHSLGHFTVDLSELNTCGGATIVSTGTTAPYATSDPPCAALPGGGDGVIKWEVTVADGDCATFTLVLEGDVETGTVQVGTKAGNQCTITAIPGPACEESDSETANASASPTPLAGM
jgi:hypothetical protein